MISFIVPAHDEELLIGRTLEHLRVAGEAFRRPFEIVVVDDASTDRTAEIAAAGGARVVPVAHRRISSTRNAGARAALGDVLVFVDADTVLDAGTLRAALAAIDGGAAGGGAMIRFDGDVPLLGRFFEWVVSPLFRWGGLAAGCFLFCTRAAFEASGGYREDVFAAEEVWMSRALRAQGRFVVLRRRVLTSGRRVRAHSTVEILRLFAGTALHPSRLTDRDAMRLWYDPRRLEPGRPPGA